MNFISATGEAMLDPLVGLWNSFVEFVPGLIGAILVLIVGYLIGLIIGHIVTKVLVKAGLDKWMDKNKLNEAIGKLSISRILGLLTKWYIFIVFLSPAADLIRLKRLSAFIMIIANWLPKLIVALLFLLAGLLTAHYVGKRVLKAKIKGIRLFSDIVKAVIIIFAVILGLGQIGLRLVIAETTFLIIVGGIVFGLALAFGIGFGLGLRKEAEKIIAQLKKKI